MMNYNAVNGNVLIYGLTLIMLWDCSSALYMKMYLYVKNVFVKTRFAHFNN